MPAASVLTLSSPIPGLIALALALTALAIAKLRRIAMPIRSKWLVALGIILLALAAAGPTWNRPHPGTLAVMVDLSPSTRGANFRNPQFVQQRLSQLIGNAPYQLIAFADRNQPIDWTHPFDEMPAVQTRFSPPASDAIILFSDARFDLPTQSPPVYIIADDGLEHVFDASVQNLQLRGQTLVATIANSGSSRQAFFPDATVPVQTGTTVITRAVQQNTTTVSVKLNPADLWPENDSLSLHVAAPWTSERWWIGQTTAPNNWRSFLPENLPGIAQDYLAPAVIVIDNESADRFSPTQLDRLMQYIRDLGGSLLVLGGDHAFAAGNYDGTNLETLSPLSSSPPSPTTRWVLLIDASGSMSQDAGGVSCFDRASRAIVNLLPALPPADPVDIGQFSGVLHWWTQGQSAAQTAAIPLPPADAIPHGPTNMESALNQIAAGTNANFPTELLLLSDCDAQFDHPEELANLLADKKIHLHVLALDHGSALPTLRKICETTGGSAMEQFDPKQWATSTRILSQAARPQQIMRKPVSIVFENAAKSLPGESVSVWNRTWVKVGAEQWAGAGATLPMVAYWRVGSGCVAAAAFEPAESEIESLADLIAEKPRDPRFSVQWQTGGKVGVIVDAAEAGRFLNDLPISLEISDDSGKINSTLEQTGPGEYEATFESSVRSRIAMLKTGDEIIDRVPLPGRYPEEFDAVGNDHPAMRKLAEQTGGMVIDPAERGPIDFHWPSRQTSLTPWLCGAGFFFVAVGLLLGKFS